MRCQSLRVKELVPAMALSYKEAVAACTQCAESRL